MLSIITTSTGRPYCFSLLERWMRSQTQPWGQWLVVGEDLRGYSFTMDQEVIRRKPSKKDALPSICLNWLAAIPHIKGDKVLVIEDDDFYHPEFIETLAPCLDAVRLAGVHSDCYYRLPQREFKYMGNTGHASLACTGFTSEMLPTVERCKLHKSVFIDMYLWAEGTQESRNWKLLPNKASDGRALHVGMKNMPGVSGLGKGHITPGAADPRYERLQQWVGVEACRAYRNIPKEAWTT